jgi:teichuronic acid biosynthesis glycosyltransferase TuaG
MVKSLSNNLVSVIMPAHNSGQFISQSITSILNQSYDELELIIILDGGDDETASLAEYFWRLDDRVILIRHEQNLGIAEARNSGLKIASGRYVAFCDSDDFWVVDKLSIQLNIIKSQGVAISHASAFVVDTTGKIIGARNIPKKIDYHMMIKRNFMINSSTIIDRFVISNIYQKPIKHEDYDMWLRIFKCGCVSISSEEALVNYRIHGNNFSGNRLKSFVWTISVQREHDVSWFSVATGIFYNLFSRMFPFK